jgi:membrane fusion protein (multidrug efflux system)
VAIPPAQRDGLAPGAFVTATLNFTDQAGDVVVPQRALLVDGHETYVLVAADGKMVRRKVELGDRLTEGVVIKSGIRPGESVVIGPADQLKDGAPLPGYLVQEKR